MHFSLPGDQRGFPLRMARLGAGTETSLTVFVASELGVAPAAPYKGFTLYNLPLVTGSSDAEIKLSYEKAIREAVAFRGGKGFLIEGLYPSGVALANAPKLAGLTDPNTTLTRLTSIIATDKLDEDVAFTAPAPADVPTESELDAEYDTAPQGTKHAFFIFGMLVPALFGLSRRRVR